MHAVPRMSGNVVTGTILQRDSSPMGARSGKNLEEEMHLGLRAISSSSAANKGPVMRTQSGTELPKYFDGSQISLPQPRTSLSNTTVLF